MFKVLFWLTPDDCILSKGQPLPGMPLIFAGLGLTTYKLK